MFGVILRLKIALRLGRQSIVDVIQTESWILQVRAKDADHSSQSGQHAAQQW